MKQYLEFEHFAITRNDIISSDDLTNLRKLYGPIVGGLGILLYEYLIDISRNSDFVEVPFNFSSLNLFLNSHEHELNKSREELEALGLINTYKDDSKALTIFELQRPLSSNEIAKNPFISKLLTKKVGKTNYDKLIKANNLFKKSTNLFGFKEISANFFNIFSNTLKDNDDVLKTFYLEEGSKEIAKPELKVIAKTKMIYTPLAIGNIKYSNVYQAILNLDNTSFLKQILNKSELNEEENMIAVWSKSIKDQKALNMIIFYSVKRKNTENWFKYVNSLISEVLSKNISNFDDVEKYLDGKFKSNIRTKSIYDEKVLLKSSYLSNLKND
nr:hypothetical protein [Mycoplasmopsis canis]WQQ12357.1 hypothetical protein RRG48_03150 [Mycoplasmopsis canis]